MLTTPAYATPGPKSPLGPHTIVVRDVFCRPCLLRECPIDHRCMKRISPEAVLDLVVSRLQERSR